MTKMWNMLQVANVTNIVPLVQIQMAKIVLKQLGAIVTVLASAGIGLSISYIYGLVGQTIRNPDTIRDADGIQLI